jgi:hypothetical protein
VAARQLKTAQHQMTADQKRGNITAAALLEGSITSLQSRANDLSTVFQSDRDAMAGFTDSDSTGVAAAREQIKQDTLAYASFRRAANSK